MSERGDPELTKREDTEEARKRREQSDKQSRKLGEKLLQGWCMLEGTCQTGCLEEKAKAAKQAPAQLDLEDACEPRCQIVNLTETSAPTEDALQQSATAPSSSLSSFPPPVQFPAPSAQLESLTESVPSFPYAGLAPPQQSDVPQLPGGYDHIHPHPHYDHHAGHQHHHAGHQHHHAGQQHRHGHALVGAALETLYNKMEEARQRLAVTPAPQCAPLVNLIAECARAIEALHSLSTRL